MTLTGLPNLRADRTSLRSSPPRLAGKDPVLRRKSHIAGSTSKGLAPKRTLRISSALKGCFSSISDLLFLVCSGEINPFYARLKPYCEVGGYALREFGHYCPDSAIYEFICEFFIARTRTCGPPEEFSHAHMRYQTNVCFWHLSPLKSLGSINPQGAPGKLILGHPEGF